MRKIKMGATVSPAAAPLPTTAEHAQPGDIIELGSLAYPEDIWYYLVLHNEEDRVALVRLPMGCNNETWAGRKPPYIVNEARGNLESFRMSAPRDVTVTFTNKET